MRVDKHLVVFAKAPRMGIAKRRLARDIGVVAAWRAYRRTLAVTLARLQDGGRWRCWLAVTPDRAVRRPGLWPSGWRRIPQGAGDLGQRMARPFLHLPPGPVVIVGADIPGIEARHVAAAFRSLGGNDAVFGPAADGGYWLVGLSRRRFAHGLFRDVRWSGPETLADTLANLPSKASVGFLDVLEDLDDGQAFARLGRGADVNGEKS